MGLPEAIRKAPAWALVLALVAILRAITSAIVPLTPEEAYHWNYAAHLDWSYYDHPPMIAWAIAAGRLLFGDTPFGVRFVPILMGLGTAWIVARLALRFYGANGALWASLLVSIEPLVLVSSGAGFPDAPVLFFWASTLLFVWKALDTGRRAWWLAGGAALGAAMLSKYTAVFFVPSALLYLLFSKRDRRWLATPWPYAAGITALAVFSPVLYWNAVHDWASFHFQSVDRLEQANRFNPLGAARFLGQQWLGFFPLVLPLAALGFLRGARSPRPEERFLFWSAAPLPAFFFLLSWTRPIHLMWPMPAYLGLTVLMAGGAAAAREALSRFYAARRGWLVGISAAGFAAGAFHAAFFLPLFSPFQGLYGWKEVAARAKEVRSGMSPGTFYLGVGRKYTCPSQLAFHLRVPGDVHGQNLLGLSGLQYEFWSDPEELRGRDAVVVLEAGDRESATRLLLDQGFASVQEAEKVVVPIGRSTLLETPPFAFLLFRATGYRPPPGVRSRGVKRPAAPFK
jgi:dolichol-phosphate mannosyltransferase